MNPLIRCSAASRRVSSRHFNRSCHSVHYLRTNSAYGFSPFFNNRHNRFLILLSLQAGIDPLTFSEIRNWQNLHHPPLNPASLDIQYPTRYRRRGYPICFPACTVDLFLCPRISTRAMGVHTIPLLCTLASDRFCRTANFMKRSKDHQATRPTLFRPLVVKGSVFILCSTYHILDGVRVQFSPRFSRHPRLPSPHSPVKRSRINQYCLGPEYCDPSSFFAI
jgi:hypothetical protein